MNLAVVLYHTWNDPLHHIYQATGKGNTPAAADNIADIQKFKGKVATGEESYNFSNQKVKTEIVLARRTHDQLMEATLITLVTCQVSFVV